MLILAWGSHPRLWDIAIPELAEGSADVASYNPEYRHMGLSLQFILYFRH